MNVIQGTSGLALADMDDGDVCSFGNGHGDLAMKLNAGAFEAEADREGKALCVWIKTGVMFGRAKKTPVYVYPRATCVLEPD